MLFVSAVLVGMMLSGFGRVVIGMLVMPMRYVGVMGSLLMISTLVMLSGFMMVPRRVLVMLSGFLMVICAFVGHRSFLSRIGFAGTWITPAARIYLLGRFA